ncbi:MAG: DUF4294 domain-containing protein [Bacteroidales bacterium]|nr:DUF4294 domain-containing protein [Bacteroidales bacterium]
MKKTLLTCIILIFSVLQIFAQQKVAEKGYLLPAVIVDGDTLALVKLPKVYVFPKLKFVTQDEYNKYKKLVRDVKKVYPYVMIAKNTFDEVQMIMDTLPNKKAQKKYIKQKEDEMLDLYARELMKLTFRQGQILIKLVNRELKQSPFEILRELRGGVKAAMYQSMAKVFGEDLKNTYDASGEDKMIERIVLLLEQGSI